MSLGRALYHGLAAAYWRLACPIRSDAYAVIALALHTEAFNRELSKGIRND